MWVFGYGSLIWDGWEGECGCSRRAVATLQGYRRTFNKASTRNWGTVEAPCPTLNLEQIEAGVCIGVAFEFPSHREEAVRKYLSRREGPEFEFRGVTVRLDDGSDVPACVALYQGENLVRAVTVPDKAAMVRNAVGLNGTGAAYVKGIADKLAEIGIEDPAVTELWQEVHGRG